MEKKNYNMKKTISMKRFIQEFGEGFSKHMKSRLLDLEIPCVLTRKEDSNRLDIKHVEHTQYDSECGFQDEPATCRKEFCYGQFVVIDGELYYSENCLVNEKVMESPIVDTIFSSLDTQNIIFDENSTAKRIDDSNIDYIIDAILSVCPKVSQSYMDIMSKYL
jgi:hypothetical protein